MTEPRTRVVHTVDHGSVEIVCPAWCAGEHEDGGYRIDIAHYGDDHTLTLPVHRGRAELLLLALEQRPFTEGWPGREAFVSVGFGGDHHPAGVLGLECMAIELERHAEELREFARRLAVLAEDAR
ncbi:hypothetical protein B1R27_29970 [Streptomyces sp. GKU 895]|nr:hypothetical protein B1R27_29970 [Streptomyces sp. GKU 895]